MSPALQAGVVGLAVGAAALWVVWSILLPRPWRHALTARLGRRPKGGCERCGS